MGHKAEYSSYAADNTVDNQAVEPVRRADAGKPFSYRRLDPFREQGIIGKIGDNGAQTADRDIVNHKHDRHEDRQGQPPVGDNPVDFIGGGQGLFLFADTGFHNLRYVFIPLVGNDAFAVVVQFLFHSGYNGLDGLLGAFGQLDGFQHLFIPLEQLDSIPAGVGIVYHAVKMGADSGQGLLHGFAEFVLGNSGFSGACQGNSLGCRLPGACALQGAGFYNLAAQGFAKPFNIDLVAVFFD